MQYAEYSSGNVYILNVPSSLDLAGLARPYVYGGGEAEGVERKLAMTIYQKTYFLFW